MLAFYDALPTELSRQLTKRSKRSETSDVCGSITANKEREIAFRMCFREVMVTRVKVQENEKSCGTHEPKVTLPTAVPNSPKLSRVLQ